MRLKQLLAAADRFILDMQWSPERTELEKTLVAGNVRGFAAALAKLAIPANGDVPITREFAEEVFGLNREPACEIVGARFDSERDLLVLEVQVPSLPPINDDAAMPKHVLTPVFAGVSIVGGRAAVFKGIDVVQSTPPVVPPVP